MQSLESRISALETLTPPGERINTIIRKLVSPGRLSEEIKQLRDEFGKLWARSEGESESDLIARATQEATRSPNGFATLIGES